MNFAELVPQVFFDAIARFTRDSGIVLIATAGAIWFLESTPIRAALLRQVEPNPVTTAVVVLLFAYVLAVALEGVRVETKRIRSVVGRLTRRKDTKEQRKDEWRMACEDFAKVYPNRASLIESRPSDAIAIDSLRVSNPAVGARIVKLRAEIAMCRTLAVGWGSLLLLVLLQSVGGILTSEGGGSAIDILSQISAPVTLLAIGIRAVGTRRWSLDGRHLRALYNHWLLLVVPGVDPRRVTRFGPAGQPGEGPPALLLSLAAMRADNKIKNEGVGQRKHAVTEVYDSEEYAKEVVWRAPTIGEKAKVLEFPDLEVATFSETAAQDRHYHKNGTEMYSVLEGTMQIEVKGEVYQLEAGDMIVISPGSIHEVRTKGHKFVARVVIANCGGKGDKYVVPRECPSRC